MPSVMPLGTDWTEKVSYKYSVTQEMIWSLHVLSDPSHHQDRLDWCLRVGRELPGGLAADLEYLGASFDEWGCIIQLIEAIEGEKLFPWPRVLAELSEMGQALFVYFMLGRKVKVGELIRFIRHPALTEHFLDKNPNLGDPELIRGLLADPERIRSKLLETLGQYWNLIFDRETKRLEPIFYTSLREKIEIAQTGGLDALLASLGLGIRLMNNRLVGRAIIEDEEAELNLSAGQVERIIIMPTVFATPHHFPIFDQKQLLLRYPLPYPEDYRQQLSDAELLEVLKGLANGTRLKILRLIAEKPRYSGELAAELDFSEPTISRHMKQLRKAGIVEVEKKDNFVYYCLQPNVLAALGDALANYLGLNYWE